jgi:serine/threonine protein kinase
MTFSWVETFYKREFLCANFEHGLIWASIHQDFKPSNIMIARQNSSSYQGTSFKLIDFAFAQFRKRDPGGPALVFDEGGTQLFSK